MDVSIRLRQEHDFYYKSFLAVFALKSARWPASPSSQPGQENISK